MKRSRMLLRYRRRDVWRWQLSRRWHAIAPLVLVPIAVVGVAELRSNDDSAARTLNEPTRRSQLVLDCDGADVVDMKVVGDDEVSIEVAGAMTGTVSGNRSATGVWSGGPGRVTISYTGADIRWTALYGFCDRHDETVATTDR